MTFNEFMNYCEAYGGNWSAMLMSGIKNAFPDVYAELPNSEYDFLAINFIVDCLLDENDRTEYNGIAFLGNGKFSYQKI